MRCLRSGEQFQRLTKSVTEDVWCKHGSQGCQFYQQKMLYYNFVFLCCFLIRANFLSKGHSYSYWESKLDNYLQLLTITDFILALIAWPIWQRVWQFVHLGKTFEVQEIKNFFKVTDSNITISFGDTLFPLLISYTTIPHQSHDDTFTCSKLWIIKMKTEKKIFFLPRYQLTQKWLV